MTKIIKMKSVIDHHGNEVLVNESLVKEIRNNPYSSHGQTIIFYINDDILQTNHTLEELKDIFNDNETPSEAFDRGYTAGMETAKKLIG